MIKSRVLLNIIRVYGVAIISIIIALILLLAEVNHLNNKVNDYVKESHQHKGQQKR